MSVSNASVALTSTTAKFNPLTVAMEPAVITVFFGVSIVLIGASNVKDVPRVPTIADTDSATLSEPESPERVRHSTAVSVVHADVSHAYTPLPSTVLAVRSAALKFSPPRVMETKFDVAVLIGALAVRAGASKVMVEDSVPTMPEMVTALG
jgi:hypothetical protein